MRPAPALALEGVTAGYGRTTVLRDVSIEVQPGAVVGLLGPNGAGKTTLLRVASGVITPSVGRRRIDGADVTDARADRLVGLGLCHVPEGRGIFRSLTVRENLALQSPPGRVPESIEQAVASFPKLGQRLEQVAGTMSGGEQQMLALARAFVQTPRVVLLDEVSMGLAPVVIDDIYEAVATLATRGVALLLVEQYVDRVLEIADRIYVLRSGELHSDQAADDVDREDLVASYLGE